MKRTLVVVCALIATAVTATAQFSLIGTWTSNDGDIRTTQTFFADNTYQLTLIAPVQRQNIRIDIKGTWNRSGNKLTSRGKHVQVSNVSEETKQSLLKQITPQLKKSSVATIKWVSQNKLFMTDPKGVQACMIRQQAIIKKAPRTKVAKRTRR